MVHSMCWNEIAVDVEDNFTISKSLQSSTNQFLGRFYIFISTKKILYISNGLKVSNAAKQEEE